MEKTKETMKIHKKNDETYEYLREYLSLWKSIKSMQQIQSRSVSTQTALHGKHTECESMSINGNSIATNR